MIKGIGILLATLLPISCNNNLENKDLINHIEQLNENVAFTLDTIETKDWDSVYIITPYAHGSFENQLNNIPYFDKSKIENASLSEGECSLVFVKHQKVVSYAIVSRSIADFSSIGDIVLFATEQRYKLDAHRVVHLD